MMLTAPKRRPELTTSMKYIYRMLDNKPNNVIINAFYIVKGCNCCNHSEYDNAIKLLNKNYPWLKVESFNLIPPLERYYGYDINSQKEFYSAMYHNSRRWNFPRYNKFTIVTDYVKMIQLDAYNKYPETDIYISLEDDQTYDSDAINKIINVVNINSKNNNSCYVKGAINNNHIYSGYTSEWRSKDYQLYGVWGIIRTKEEMKSFYKYVKFVYQNNCIDYLAYEYCKLTNKTIYADASIMYHFGWDKKLPIIKE